MSKALLRIASSGLAVASFLAVSTGIRGQMVAPANDEGSEKLAWFTEHAAEYPALLIGSSAIFRGLDPTSLDPEVEKVVPEWKSFNLGVRGMRAFEQDHLLRRAVEAAGENLRWVVMEPQAWTPQVELTSIETERVVTWHDLAHTAAALNVTFGSRLTLADRLEWSAFHLRTYLYHLGNYGGAKRLLCGFLGGELEHYLTEEAIEARRGYIPIEESEAQTWEKRNESFLEERRIYRRQLAILLRGRPSPLPSAVFEAHRAQRQWLEQRGLTVIYVMPPFAGSGGFVWTLEREGEMPLFIDFLHPDRYPEFYVEDARLDREHLKAAAAAVLSSRCGAEIGRLIDPRNGGPVR